MAFHLVKEVVIGHGDNPIGFRFHLLEFILRLRLDSEIDQSVAAINHHLKTRMAKLKTLLASAFCSKTVST